MEKYTDEALLALAASRIEAIKHGSLLIEPEHLALALSLDETGPAGRLLAKAGLDVDKLREAIEARLMKADKLTAGGDVPLSAAAKRVLVAAEEDAKALMARHIGSEHVLLALARTRDTLVFAVFHELGIDAVSLKTDILLLQKDARISHPSGAAPADPLLEAVGEDLVALAQADALGLCVGREEQLDRLIELLCLKRNPNALVVGEPGVGRTSLVHGLARRMAQVDIPFHLHGKRLLGLDAWRIAAWREELEPRLEKLAAAIAARDDLIVVIEDLDSPALSGPSSLELDTARLARYLARHARSLIATTTSGQQRELFHADRLFRQSFNVIGLDAPGELEAVVMLEAHRPLYEEHHGVKFEDEALRAAISLSEQHMPELFLPAKALALLDQAAAKVKLAVRSSSGDVREIEAKLQLSRARMQQAMSRKDLQKAVLFRNEEAMLRRQLRAVKQGSTTESPVVGRAAIEAALSQMTGLPQETLRERAP